MKVLEFVAPKKVANATKVFSKIRKKPASFRVKKETFDNNYESLILQDEWNVLELIGGGGWTPILWRNNIFSLCVCHILMLCCIWLPRWKACRRKKSYWSSCKRFHALWVLANYSHMFDWDNIIIHTTNHIQLCLFGIIYFCFFDWFPSNVFPYSTLYSTHLYILLWFSCECWCFHYETEKYHVEIHFDFPQSFHRCFSSISGQSPSISNVGQRSKLWQVTDAMGQKLFSNCTLKLQMQR